MERDLKNSTSKPRAASPQGQHLPREGHSHRAVRSRRPSSSMVGTGTASWPSRKSIRLLSNPRRRPRTADRRAAAPARRGRGRRASATGSIAPTSRKPAPILSKPRRMTSSGRRLRRRPCGRGLRCRGCRSRRRRGACARRPGRRGRTRRTDCHRSRAVIEAVPVSEPEPQKPGPRKSRSSVSTVRPSRRDHRSPCSRARSRARERRRARRCRRRRAVFEQPAELNGEASRRSADPASAWPTSRSRRWAVTVVVEERETRERRRRNPIRQYKIQEVLSAGRSCWCRWSRKSAATRRRPHHLPLLAAYMR